MAASIGAEAAVLAADKAEQRRIIAGTSERSSHPRSVAVSGALLERPVRNEAFHKCWKQIKRK
jgi:hypothetical protein